MIFMALIQDAVLSFSTAKIEVQPWCYINDQFTDLQVQTIECDTLLSVQELVIDIST